MDKVVKVSEHLMVVKLGDWGMFDECDLKLCTAGWTNGMLCMKW